MSPCERLHLYLFLFVHLVAVEESTAAVCTKINDCECRKSNGKLMSLKPVDSGTSNPEFPDIKSSSSPSSRSYSWNPCTKFPDGKGDNVLLSQKDSTLTYPVAKEADNFNEEDDGSITLTYKEVNSDRYTRQGVIKLICDQGQNPGKPDPFVEEKGTGEMSKYKTKFRSKCVCDEGCGSGASSGGGLSTGSVLLIVFFVLLLVYLIGGLLYQKYRKGVQSLPEMFPNHSFWADFPFLIKDGCVFTFHGIAGCCKSLCMKIKGDSYASI